MASKTPVTERLSFQIGLPLIVFSLIAVETIVLLAYRWHPGLIVLFGIASVCFIVAELYVLRRFLLRPLGSVLESVASLGSKKYTPPSVTVRNELAGLAANVDALAVKLSAQNAEDVEKLKQVIADLNKSTQLLIQRDLELSRANEKLRELDRMKSEFVSLATHQLRTPLSGVRWSLSMLLNGEMGELTPEQKLYVMKTYESNNRMITLINDMLQADRIDGGTIKFKFTPTNLLYLFDNILTELAPIAAKRNIKLNFKPAEHIPPLMIDPENMRIVIQNLVDNAIKYSREGSDVNITVDTTETEVQIAVEDHGIGIPPENQKNIFKRFFRAPNAVHTETDGSGLGLYIVESIIERHHGTIRFESKENEGTTFYVTLPITKDTQ